MKIEVVLILLIQEVSLIIFGNGLKVAWSFEINKSEEQKIVKKREGG